MLSRAAVPSSLRAAAAASSRPASLFISSCNAAKIASPSSATTPSLIAYSRSQHQRRHSSSKTTTATTPPPTTTTTTADPQAKSEKDAAATGKSSARLNRRKARNGSTTSPSSWRLQQRRQSLAAAGLPSVPPTDRVQIEDVRTAAFFSLYRPISITSPIPLESSITAFNDLFDADVQRRRASQPFHEPHGSERVDPRQVQLMFSQGHTGQMSVESDEAIKHLDSLSSAFSQPQRHDHSYPSSAQDFFLQYRPYSPPPPPQPQRTAGARNLRSKAATKQATRRRTYETTVRVTESTSADGEITFSATATPVVQVSRPRKKALSSGQAFFSPNATTSLSTTEPQPSLRNANQPFLRRMHARRMAYVERQIENARQRGTDASRGTMRLISVKRQRKLKMKKHKYKKLMRRTRSLRRRIEKDK